MFDVIETALLFAAGKLLLANYIGLTTNYESLTDTPRV